MLILFTLFIALLTPIARADCLTKPTSADRGAQTPADPEGARTKKNLGELLSSQKKIDNAR